jgi:hypothetical protein
MSPTQTVLALAVLGQSMVLSAADLRIRILDQAGLDPKTVRAAAATAADLFRPAGVRASVSICGDCPTEIDADEIVVRIILKRSSDNDARLGMSFVAGTTGKFATVYAPAVIDAAARESVPREVVLGHVIAHEVAHLLGVKHGGGIMRDGWSCGDYRRIGTTGLAFGRKDTAAIGHSAAARNPHMVASTR